LHVYCVRQRAFGGFLLNVGSSIHRQGGRTGTTATPT
jgi:hypothetical protein